MAISGTGTQADPYIVDNWSDFDSICGNANEYVKFKNPHEADGTITLNGTGTESDPYIVSAYEELLFATGATYIWQVKLIDSDSKIYLYGDVYCRYDASLSTIDFNDIQPNGFDNDITIRAYVDYNGWTFKNLIMNDGVFGMRSSIQKNLILSNYIRPQRSSYYCIYDDGGSIENCIFDISVNNDSTTTQSIFYVSTSNFLKNCSVSISARGSAVNIGACRFNNSRVFLDIDATSCMMSNVRYTNTLVEGTIKSASTNNETLANAIRNSIFDVSYINPNAKLIKSDSVDLPSFYNADKISDTTGLTATNLYAATTGQLRNASWLRERGLPIGGE